MVGVYDADSTMLRNKEVLGQGIRKVGQTADNAERVIYAKYQDILSPIVPDFAKTVFEIPAAGAGTTLGTLAIIAGWKMLTEVPIGIYKTVSPRAKTIYESHKLKKASKIA